MRLIEKECPNCGAGLSFTKEDTTCKCEYCKREFEIERDPEQKRLVDQFSLSELKTPFKIFSFLTFGGFFTQALMIFGVFIIVIVIAGFGIFFGGKDPNTLFSKTNNYVTSPSDLSDSDYNTLDLNSRIVIAKETTGNTNGFVNKNSFKRVKLYVISKRNRNYLIPVYKTTYEYFSNSDIKYDVYTAVIYKNVKSRNNSIAYTLNHASVVDTEFHFNEGGYTYGYGDIESLYNDVIKYYEEKGYKIVEQ